MTQAQEKTEEIQQPKPNPYNAKRHGTTAIQKTREVFKALMIP